MTRGVSSHTALYCCNNSYDGRKAKSYTVTSPVPPWPLTVMQAPGIIISEKVKVGVKV